MVAVLNFSHYRPTPESRRFSISTFAVVGQVAWEAKPAGEFSARVDVLKGAFAKMIPFTAMEASVRVVTDTSGDGSHRKSARKEFVMKTIGGRGALAEDGGKAERRKTWDDVHVISAIEIPWVAEYQLQRWSVGGEQETRFRFEDNQRVREAILYFREDPNAGVGDAMAILRVLKPEEPANSIVTSRTASTTGAKLKVNPEPRPGDVLVTFRDTKIHGFTVFVPLIGKLQFVSEKPA